MTRTFILGLGAQKAGTTWLHSELSRFAGADFGWTKEYHFLDSHTVDYCRPFFEQRVHALKELTSRNRTTDIISKIHGKRIGYISLLAFHNNPDLYFDYFSSRLRGGVKLTGDFTPSNSLISSESMRWVKDEFSERSIRCAAIFVMRDPVERFWSAIRMIRKKNFERWSEVSEEVQVRESLSREDYLARGQYQNIISSIESCFSDNERKIILYEELTSSSEVFTEICEFLYVPPYVPRFENYENASPKSSGISTDLMTEIALKHKEAYDAASSIFGKDKLIKLWPSYQLIL
jgi:hypothetical protein